MLLIWFSKQLRNNCELSPSLHYLFVFIFETTANCPPAFIIFLCLFSKQLRTVPQPSLSFCVYFRNNCELSPSLHLLLYYYKEKEKV
jgi:hypothetical protein